MFWFHTQKVLKYTREEDCFTSLKIAGKARLAKRE
jgi:hypothetical protein